MAGCQMFYMLGFYTILIGQNNGVSFWHVAYFRILKNNLVCEKLTIGSLMSSSHWDNLPHIANMCVK